MEGVHDQEKWKTSVPYLILNIGVALRASRDLLDDPMPFDARRLDEPPIVRHLKVQLSLGGFGNS